MNATDSDDAELGRPADDLIAGILHPGEEPPLLRVAPLFPPAFGAVAGIILDRFLLAPPGAYLIVLASAAVVACLLHRRSSISLIALLLAGVALGSCLHAGLERRVRPDSVAHYAAGGPQLARLRGTVATEPQRARQADHPFARWIRRESACVFLLSASELEGEPGSLPASGMIRVKIREPVLNLAIGERVELFGWMYPLPGPSNPGGFDFAAYAANQGIVAGLTCRHQENVKRLPGETDSPASPGWREMLRRQARDMLTGDLVTAAPEEIGLLEAMVLGARSRIDRKLNDVFIRAGCAHFLAVSGIHVAIVMWLAAASVRLIGARSSVKAVVMITAVVLYATLAEPRPPILRASIMGVLYGVSRLLGRERTHLNWLSAAVLALALLDPGMIFDVGYQLSFAAVIGVAYLTPLVLYAAAVAGGVVRRAFGRSALADRLRPRPRGGTPGQRMGRWVARLPGRLAAIIGGAAAVSTAAWLAGLPVVAWHFERIQVWAIPASVVVFPLVGLTMALSFGKLLLGLLGPALAESINGPLQWVDAVLINVVEAFASLPAASISLSPPPFWLVAAYYALLLFLALEWAGRARRAKGRVWAERMAIWSMHAERTAMGIPAETPLASGPATAAGRAAGSSRHPADRILLAGILLASVSVAVGSFRWIAGPSPDSSLRVTFLDVGSGTAAVIELPDGRAMLYDVGTPGDSDVARHTVAPFLRHRGIRRLERVFISHPNLDHFSGLPAILDELQVGPVVVNHLFVDAAGDRSPAAHLLELLRLRAHPLITLDPLQPSWNEGDVLFEVLWPTVTSTPTLSSNDTSTVLRLTYAGRSILLPGDIEDTAEAALLQRGGITADVLMLPHHGSVRPTTAPFLRAVNPGFLVRSSHQRMANTDNGLREIVGSTAVYNTADVGAVTVTFDPGGGVDGRGFTGPE